MFVLYTSAKRYKTTQTMGLDTSHDCWHGAYSAFTRWRHEIARKAGYWVMPVKYENGMTMDLIILDWGHLPPGHLMGEWPEVPSDPLLILFTHQDCEGIIKAEHCGVLADALEEILPKLPDEEAGGHIGNWRDKTQKFISGLRLAHERKEDVDFH